MVKRRLKTSYLDCLPFHSSFLLPLWSKLHHLVLRKFTFSSSWIYISALIIIHIVKTINNIILAHFTKTDHVPSRKVSHFSVLNIVNNYLPWSIRFTVLKTIEAIHVENNKKWELCVKRKMFNHFFYINFGFNKLLIT